LGSGRSAAQKAAWAAMPDEVRSERLDKGRATYAANYPWRVAFTADLRERIAAGDVLPKPCDQCGNDAAPLISWDNEAKTCELIGWRCYPCQNATRPRPVKSSPSDSK
jgi:hypothetical protein